ncbi:hypothetical protein [Oscillibacter sp.]|uniref:hypothetical protein n=1 Tax=Oscillibacter sp. TaxID=1945593 RepID=UPI00257A9552|nr:hypothetical protein [Oscillibacter sp.]
MATYAVGVEPSDNLLVNGLQRLEEYDYDLTEEGELAKSAWNVGGEAIAPLQPDSGDSLRVASPLDSGGHGGGHR